MKYASKEGKAERERERQNDIDAFMPLITIRFFINIYLKDCVFFSSNIVREIFILLKIDTVVKFLLILYSNKNKHESISNKQCIKIRLNI
jgi:hypothetical protein